VAEVRFSRKALADLRAIHAYLVQHNPAAAAKVVAAIENSASLIAEYPELGHRTDSELDRIHIVPRFGYVISYRIAGDTIEIRYVFHPRQSR
jgi:plasmid stabilization system protein ParE